MKLFLIVLITVFFGSSNLSAFTGNGSGTESDPYQITNVEQLQEISDDLKAHYMLMNDIDASETKDWNDGKGFDPIGDYDREIDSIGFMGSLNGNGYTINELFINRAVENNIGLFGCIYEDGNVRDAFLQNASVKGAVSVGLFAGLIRTKYADILIENCHSEGAVEGAARIGGFCGETYAFLGEIAINNCSSTAIVSGENSVGGFSGKNEGNGDFVNIRSCSSNCIVLGVDPGHKNIGGFSGHDQVTYNQVGFGEIVVQQCVSTGSVKGDDRAGGFIGSCLGSIYINCVSLCSVEGIGHIGGFVGKILKINVPFPSLLKKCYSVGSVKGSFNVGGFCGIIVADEKWDIKYSYYDAETSGRDSSDGGTGKTTAQMKTRSTFETWDFDNIWDIDPEINNGYPFLRCLPTVSVEELISSQIKKLEIRPNPAQDQIQIVFEDEAAIISLVEIFDLSGRLILTSKTDRIDVSLLSSGIYWVSVESDGEISSTKLIVKK